MIIDTEEVVHWSLSRIFGVYGYTGAFITSGAKEKTAVSTIRTSTVVAKKLTKPL